MMTQAPDRLPRLAITLGDVAGIGPEITAKLLMNHEALRQKARLTVIGDVDVMKATVSRLGGDPALVRRIEKPADATNAPGTIEVLQAGPSLAEVKPGQIDPAAGDGSVRFVTTACALARAGEIDGVVTAPLNKAAMHAAGHKWPGHTELLAHEFGVKTFSLVLSAGDLYIFHATTHVSLRQAIEDVTPARMRAVLRLAGSFARALDRADAPVAVAGLNPHAGENGLFGNEDADILAVAVAEANAEGILAAGPIPADALFPQAVRGKWKFVIACYHDQGHAPFKSVYGDDGVNITVGLPVVRVSVDHGTAFDIAGKGIAREGSLVLAVERAAHLVPGWTHVWKTAQAQTGG
ncbi:4-hydroxythreonine-4-phosphate dehydrogenase PdxA [Halotalea alkalilenta]|uniref:4-hydroxythreonine-4-phosphate dehydrogenase PdxA n=1 Tax=Halotalea alkalilenta TaxID=376489 RepID=UPI000B28341C|nr:4-hydroxythreonine-4-phosphate dehydrogenase PdxA [Halotalea alkalilenta]